MEVSESRAKIPTLGYTMNSKLRLVDAGNVVVPAFLTLLERGYSVRSEKSEDSSVETWIAERDSTELLARDPVTLLGLAAIIETRGHGWMASDDQIEDFLHQFGFSG